MNREKAVCVKTAFLLALFETVGISLYCVCLSLKLQGIRVMKKMMSSRFLNVWGRQVLSYLSCF